MGNSLRSLSGEITLAALLAFAVSGIVGCSGGGGGGGGAPATPPVNAAPVANADVAVTPIDAAVTIDVLGNDSDPEGDVLSLVSVSAPGSGTAVDDGSGQVLYTPSLGFTGVDTFTYTIQDATGNTATSGVSVTVGAAPNAAPTANPDVAVTLIDVAVTIDVLGNDTDPEGDALSLVSVSLPGNGTAIDDGSGQVLYTPSLGFTGVDTFTYTIQDTNGNTAISGVSVTVSPNPNAAPVAVDDAATTDEDNSVVISVLSNDSDPDMDVITVTLVSSGASGTTSISGGGTTVTYTPTADFNGQDSFEYTITDALGTPALATVTVTVNSVNDAPVALDDSATTASPTPVVVNVLDNDIDIESDPLTTVSVTTPSNGSVVINGDNSVTYTPNAGFTGTDMFDYDVDDGTDLDTGTVTVTVTAPPVLNFEVSAVVDGAQSFDVATGVGSVSVLVQIEEDGGNPNFPNGVTGVDLSLDHDPTRLVAASASEGSALNALGGAEFFDAVLSDGNVTLDIIVSSTGAPVLLAATPEELAIIDYDTVEGTFTGNANSVSVDFLWSPGLVNNVEAGGSVSAPNLIDGSGALDPIRNGSGFQFLAPGGVATYDPATGVGSFVQPIFVIEDTAGVPTEFDGVSVGVAHDPTLLTPSSVEQSAALQALNGGSGPSFFEVSILADGITAGGIFDFTVTNTLNAATPVELIRVNYDTVPGALAGNATGVATSFSFVDTLGSPVIFNIISVAGVTAFPSFIEGTTLLQP